jgi:hypothetical protein
MSQIATVERSPEKAGVGDSIPSLATIPINKLGAQVQESLSPRLAHDSSSVGVLSDTGPFRKQPSAE